MTENQFVIKRRTALLGLTSAIALGPAAAAFGAPAVVLPQGQRFVVVILRGALDGLAAVAPYGDPNLAIWRSGLLTAEPGQQGGLLDLGGHFGLHPALSGLHAMYVAGEMLPVHAVAGPYRSRSHFEAQDYLESGSGHRMTSGWLNRVVSVLPAAQRGNSPGGPAIAVSGGIPLLLRGPATVGSWEPEMMAEPSSDLCARIAALVHDDPLIGPAVAEGLREREFARRVIAGADGASMDAEGQPGRTTFAALAAVAGRLLGASDGPRIAALEIGGWDTHAGQVGHLHAAFRRLDDGLTALRDGLGNAWAQTVVLVVTEFGRTVRMNGTAGTDHGTGTVAFVLGGTVAGGRIRTNWPNLERSNLFEDRDLQPTADLRSIAKGLLAEHLQLSQDRLAWVFPESAAAAPMAGLVRDAKASSTHQGLQSG
jgi:uncharacterized protein (DUF1501 family)